MRVLILIPLFFSTGCNVFAQAKELNDKQLARYSYRYTFDFKIDSIPRLSVSFLPSKLDLDSLTIVALKNDGSPLSNSTIVLITHDSIFKAITSTEGVTRFKLTSDSVVIGMASTGYKYFSYSLMNSRGLSYRVSIFPGETPSLDTYTIYSRKKLSDKQIDCIRKCMDGKSNETDRCNRKGRYYIMINI